MGGGSSPPVTLAQSQSCSLLTFLTSQDRRHLCWQLTGQTAEAALGIARPQPREILQPLALSFKPSPGRRLWSETKSQRPLRFQGPASGL